MRQDMPYAAFYSDCYTVSKPTLQELQAIATQVTPRGLTPSPHAALHRALPLDKPLVDAAHTRAGRPRSV